MKRIKRTLLGLVLACAAAWPALAQPYPSRPVRMVVPFPPGNAADLTARVLAEEAQRRLNLSIVVENRAGGSGAIGVQAVTTARPDGYTLLVTSLSPVVVNPALIRNLPYDPARDLAPVSLIGWTGYVFAVAPDFPARNLAEAIAVLRASPGRFSAGNPGVGTLAHLTTELFGQLTGARVESVPYRGSGAALLDLSTGRLAVMIDAMTSALPQVQGGRVRGLAVVQGTRSALAPDLPSMPETGVPELRDFQAQAWIAMFGPAGLAGEATEFWNREMNRWLADPAFAARLTSQNLEAAPPAPPSRLAELVAADLAKWQRVARDSNIEMQ
ncbi:Bug family tripartite tricarboxylate transporter substrate binding protein [Falsiroseomonas sp. CW058]|uniref:Bug family tripartite tricarboxylate transporter substrate binding protein n=1 Tax=Falsiroseomonas sp. CW058 TaxID=3388664 RepID=UPI003D30F9DC